MTCKDCIHYKICLDNGDDAAKQNAPNAEKECDTFKNKADFVEVVRCGNCIHRIEHRWEKCTGRRPDEYCSDGISRWRTEKER